MAGYVLLKTPSLITLAGPLVPVKAGGGDELRAVERMSHLPVETLLVFGSVSHVADL